MATKNTAVHRLFRSESDRMLGGVCGGLGEYLNIDSSLVRLIFVAVTIFGGGGVVAYLILWAILPTEARYNPNSRNYINENVEEIKSTAKDLSKKFKGGDVNSGKLLGGLVLLSVGGFFLLHNFGFFQFWQLGQLWPLILIALGIAIIYNKHD